MTTCFNLYLFFLILQKQTAPARSITPPPSTTPSAPPPPTSTIYATIVHDTTSAVSMYGVNVEGGGEGVVFASGGYEVCVCVYVW